MTGKRTKMIAYSMFLRRCAVDARFKKGIPLINQALNLQKCKNEELDFLFSTRTISELNKHSYGNMGTDEDTIDS